MYMLVLLPICSRQRLYFILNSTNVLLQCYQFIWTSRKLSSSASLICWARNQFFFFNDERLNSLQFSGKKEQKTLLAIDQSFNSYISSWNSLAPMIGKRAQMESSSQWLVKILTLMPPNVTIGYSLLWYAEMFLASYDMLGLDSLWHGWRLILGRSQNSKRLPS